MVKPGLPLLLESGSILCLCRHVFNTVSILQRHSPSTRFLLVAYSVFIPFFVNKTPFCWGQRCALLKFTVPYIASLPGDPRSQGWPRRSARGFWNCFATGSTAPSCCSVGKPPSRTSTLRRSRGRVTSCSQRVVSRRDSCHLWARTFR